MTADNPDAKNLERRRASKTASRSARVVQGNENSGPFKGIKRIKLSNAKRNAQVLDKTGHVQNTADGAERPSRGRRNALRKMQLASTKAALRAARNSRLHADAALSSEMNFKTLVADAERIFGDVDKAMRWLGKPKAALHGKTPREAVQTEDGVKLVRSMLVRIEHGMIG